MKTSNRASKKESKKGVSQKPGPEIRDDWESMKRKEAEIKGIRKKK